MNAVVFGERNETVSALIRAVTDRDGRDQTGETGDVIVLLRGSKSVALATVTTERIIVSADDYELVAAAKAVAAATATATEVEAEASPPSPRLITFGLSASADFVASEIESDLSGTVFTLVHEDTSYRVSLHLLGEQHVEAALAAIAAASALGVAITEAIAAIGGVTTPERWVMQPIVSPGGALVINDAQGANRASMAAALKDLALFTAHGRRSVAVLGALDSAPADALDDHDSIGRLVVRLNIKKLVVVGFAARHIQVAAGLEGSWDGESVLVETAEEAYDLLSEELCDDDVVLVKSSAAAGLRFFGDKLGGMSE